MLSYSDVFGFEPGEHPTELLSGTVRQQYLLMELASDLFLKLLPRLTLDALAPSKPLPIKAPHEIAQDAVAYVIDSLQRQTLFWDTMRGAGNAFIEHEQRGCPPLLAFDYETVLDGRKLARPVNYALIRIRVPAGCPPTDPTLRPFIVIDPRAGHGAGIGGFKNDSEVGVALRSRHPVYFVIFYREPEPGQGILDVTAAEREFLRMVVAHHPGAAKPIVIGNCQGGWAAALLAMSAPELCGPLVLNGAPLSYWAGRTGKNPMRYAGGLTGGGWPAALMADLGNGRFDGAHLGWNFESLSPGNTWFRKYYDLYAKVDTEAYRFLEFERWWGGMFLMNGAEMRWIVDNLFMGNRLTHDEIETEAGETLSIRALRSPLIIFASEGDNITSPGQALHWIASVYGDEHAIKSLGQTIIYMVHKSIGHLGIFVSGTVARKEHNEIASTLEVIEEVAPGLYEMLITDQDEGGYEVELVERTVADIRALSGDDMGAEAFPAVAHVSAMTSKIYDTVVSPVVRALVTEESAELARRLHPMRLRRHAVSDANPALAGLPVLAEAARRHRSPAAPDNFFVAVEQALAERTEQMLNAWRDLRDATVEAAFYGVYGWLAVYGVGRQARNATAQSGAARLTEAAEAQEVTSVELQRQCRRGGYAEAVIRIMVLLADARGAVRRQPLERSKALLNSQPPFATMTELQRRRLIQTQAALVVASPDECIAALPLLLPERAMRHRALAAVEHVAGPAAELGEPVRDMLERIRNTLGLGRQAFVPRMVAAG